MHPEQIKAALRMKGVTLAALADQLELSGSTITQVISGKGVSARVRGHVAQITGHPVDVLWPPKSKSGLRRTKAEKAEKAEKTERKAHDQYSFVADAVPFATAPAPQPTSAWDGVERRSGKDRRKTVQTTFVFQPKA